MRALSRARWRASADPQAAAAWAVFEEAAGDWRSLDREHVESFRILMHSLAAEPAEEQAVLPH